MSILTVLWMQAQTTTPAAESAQGWGAATWASLTAAMAMFFAALPRILAFIVILLVGWFVANLVARGILGVLRMIRFEEGAQKAGVAGVVAKTGTEHTTSEIVALTVKWLIRLVVLLVAFDALGLPAMSDVLRSFLIWLPNLFIAIAVLFVAGLAAGVIGRLVRGATAEAGFTNPDTLANVARTLVWVFAVVIAVNQLGIAETLVNTLFTGVVAAGALASGLAFGLGGRDLAARKLDDWYEENRQRRGGGARGGGA